MLGLEERLIIAASEFRDLGLVSDADIMMEAAEALRILREKAKMVDPNDLSWTSLPSSPSGSYSGRVDG